METNNPRISPDLAVATPEMVVQVCYDIAYVLFPRYGYDHFETFCRDWRTTVPSFAESLFEYGCLLRQVQQPTEEPVFRLFDGELVTGCDYYVLQYPGEPPQYRPDDPLGIPDLSRLRTLVSGDGIPVLAPFFAAFLNHRERGERRCYVLGEAPGGGTTLRGVAANGVHASFVRGPEAEIGRFLDRLRQEIQSN
jgi:hypothetical protein